MYYYQGNNFDYNECSGRGICSVTPTISSFQEVMLILLRSITYYVIELQKLGIECTDLKLNIIDGISNLISSTVYPDEQLLNIVICHYNDFIKLKREYMDFCKKQNSPEKELKIPLKLSPDMVLSDILNQGQKALAEKNNLLNSNQKFYSELLSVMLKSVSLSILKLSDYGIINRQAIDTVVLDLNIYNQNRIHLNKVKEAVAELAKIDLGLWKHRKNAQIEVFGDVIESEVSLSTTSGKAILVSGSNLMDLYNLLENLEDEKLDIYSHGDLLISHAFKNFKKFKNFKGHYGTSNDNCILDFATFPGAILLTKHATQNTEYLIRGRLFTTDDIPPKGVMRVSENNYSAIVNAAYKSKGFSKGKKKQDIIVGFDEEELSAKLDKLKTDISSGTIKGVFVIGMSNISPLQADYFNTLLKKAAKDIFTISFSYNCDVENFLYINIANNFPMQLMVLDLLFQRIPVTEDKLTFFLTKCDANTLSSIISLKGMGAKNIYLSDCPPTVINPAVMNPFMKLYGINRMNNPKYDLNNIL